GRCSPGTPPWPPGARADRRERPGVARPLRDPRRQRPRRPVGGLVRRPPARQRRHADGHHWPAPRSARTARAAGQDPRPRAVPDLGAPARPRRRRRPGAAMTCDPDPGPAAPVTKPAALWCPAWLRICWVVHGPSGWAVTPRMCTQREPTSMTNRQYGRWSVTAQSTWKKSAASMVAARVRRNCRHVVSVSRTGAGWIPAALSTRRIVDALTPWPRRGPRGRPSPAAAVARCGGARRPRAAARAARCL